MKKNLFIHIGHGKTGTSAIQAALAANLETLEQHSVHYPYHKSFKHAAVGGVSSGNGSVLLDGREKTDFGSENLLFSGEQIFHRLNSRAACRAILDKARASGHEVIFICYTRDFFEHSFSEWGQSIKRGGGTQPYECFVSERYKTFENLLRWVVRAKADGLELRLFNYDRLKDRLIDHFFRHALGLADLAEDIQHVHKGRINRSLTLAEYELQRQFNIAYANKSSSFISDPLVERCPNIQSEMPVIDKESYTRIVARHSSLIEEVNLYLDAESQIILTPYEELYADLANDLQDRFCFSSEQLVAFAEAVSRRLTLVDKCVPSEADSAVLNDMARRIEAGETLDPQNAVVLRQLTRRAALVPKLPENVSRSERKPL